MEHEFTEREQRWANWNFIAWLVIGGVGSFVAVVVATLP